MLQGENKTVWRGEESRATLIRSLTILALVSGAFMFLFMHMLKAGFIASFAVGAGVAGYAAIRGAGDVSKGFWMEFDDKHLSWRNGSGQFRIEIAKIEEMQYDYELGCIIIMQDATKYRAPGFGGVYRSGYLLFYEAHPEKFSRKPA